MVCVVLLVLGVGGSYFFTLQRAKQIASLAEAAEQAVARGNWGGLESIARDWASLEPKNATAWDYAAQAAMQMNNPKLSAAYLSAALPDAPVDVFQKLGFIQMEFLNDPLGTKATCDQTIQYYPTDSQTHERLLYYYTMTCQRNEVVREARRAIGLGCDTLATYAFLVSAKWLTFTNGTETNQRWLEAEPGNELFEVAAVLHLPSNPLLVELAREVTEAGSEPRPLEYAANQVQLLRKKYPSNIQLLAIETRNLCRAGDVEAVGERLSHATSAALRDNRFWRFKGWYHAARAEDSEAEAAYRQALKLNPFDWATRNQLASLLRKVQGVSASTKMQELADFGKKLMFAIQDCPVINRLEPPSLYAELEECMRLCGEPELANRLSQLASNL